MYGHGHHWVRISWWAFRCKPVRLADRKSSCFQYILHLFQSKLRLAAIVDAGLLPCAMCLREAEASTTEFALGCRQYNRLELLVTFDTDSWAVFEVFGDGLNLRLPIDLQRYVTGAKDCPDC